jgi:potassium inwardly-rectifying channel subfamily J
LIFRIRDNEKRYHCQNQVRAYVVQKRDGELVLKSIKLESYGLLIWPVEVVHFINSSSPFWDLSARDLVLKR